MVNINMGPFFDDRARQTNKQQAASSQVNKREGPARKCVLGWDPPTGF